MQFQSDISDIPVFRPTTQEATAAGAAFLAGLAVGFFRDRNEISDLNINGVTFSPGMDKEEREKLLSGWHHAVRASRAYHD